MIVRRPHLWCLLGLLFVLGQSVLPGLHVLIDHCQQASQTTTIGMVVQAPGDAHDDGLCSICAILHASGQMAPPVDDGSLTRLAASAPREIVSRAFEWVRCAPDVRSASPRGPPAA